MNKDFENSTMFDLLNRYFAGEASPDDMAKLEAWLSEASENWEVFRKYKSLWNNLEKYRIATQIDIDYEWDRFKKNNIQQEEKPMAKSLSLFAKPLRYAAIIAGFLMVGSLGYYLMNMAGNKKYMAQTELKEITLPDQSTITLNKNSKVVVIKGYDKEKREVKLTGEAYFEVEHTGKPFIVLTSGVEIEVLGTSFFVNAAKNDDSIEVIVNSGKVSVTEIKNPDNRIILVKGEKAHFKKHEKELKKLQNTDINFLSWKTKKLVFKNDKLSRVVKTLNRIHNTQIIIENRKTRNCRLTASFVDQSLESILKVIENTLDVKIVKQNNQWIIKGAGCQTN